MDWTTLPENLPRPTDDGAARHLPGAAIADVSLQATDGSEVNLSKLAGRVAVFIYPRTGRPNEPLLVPDWDAIPGARGCTPHACAYRDLAQEFARAGCRIFGLSSQETEYQREMASRLHLPFPILSDAEGRFAQAMGLPQFTVAGQTLLKRLSWVARDGKIEVVFYPVFPPDRNASEVLAWLGNNT